MNVFGIRVPIEDILTVAIPVATFLFGWVGKMFRSSGVTLPGWATEALKKLGGWSTVYRAIETAAYFSTLSEEEKRQEAAKLLKNHAARNSFDLPDSVANLLVEFGYQQWKKLRK